jgi:dTDP-4-amino-4,6-dideoxygalactose transaminase
MNSSKILFNDLKALHEDHREAFHRALDDILDSSAFIGGEAVSQFEKAFAESCGAQGAVGCSNGTDALMIALKIVGVGPGDLVVTVPNSFMATAEAITMLGAYPLFVDVQRSDANMDPSQLKRVLEKHPQADRIKAVVPVHLFGRSADMKAISAICNNKELPIVADASQAHLATCEGKGICDWADITTFSFYPGKNLGALGDAGAMVSNKPELLKALTAFINHGRGDDKHVHQTLGTNARLDAMQAMFLLEKLKKLKAVTERRQQLAKLYREGLNGKAGLVVPVDLEARPSVYHQMVIQHQKRDALITHLSQLSVATGIHYPTALHLQPALAHLGYLEGHFPIAEEMAQCQLSLPLHPGLSDDDVDKVCRYIAMFCEREGS